MSGYPETRKAWRQRRIAAGLCVQCGAKAHGKYVCADCRIKARPYVRKSCLKRRPYLREWQKRQTQKKRMEVLNHYGCRCVCCGESNPWFLTIDHKGSNGSKDPRVFGPSGYRIAGLGWWMKVIRLGFPDDLQVLCWNCNHAKEMYGNGIDCPHKLTLGT